MSFCLNLNCTNKALSQKLIKDGLCTVCQAKNERPFESVFVKVAKFNCNVKVALRQGDPTNFKQTEIPLNRPDSSTSQRGAILAQQTANAIKERGDMIKEQLILAQQSLNSSPSLQKFINSFKKERVNSEFAQYNSTTDTKNSSAKKDYNIASPDQEASLQTFLHMKNQLYTSKEDQHPPPSFQSQKAIFQSPVKRNEFDNYHKGVTSLTDKKLVNTGRNIVESGPYLGNFSQQIMLTEMTNTDSNRLRNHPNINFQDDTNSKNFTENRTITSTGFKQEDTLIESEAEEIFVPANEEVDDAMMATGAFRGKHGLKGPTKGGILGYQKYLHIMGKVILDNTDQFEPNMPNFSKFNTLEEEPNDWEDDEVDDEGEKETETAQPPIQTNKGKFSFSGMSFRDYINNIGQDLNDEMKRLVNLFIVQKQAKHCSTHLTHRKIQVRHPVFRLINLNAFKWLTDRATLLKFQKGQAAYKQDFDAMPRAYIVLYGGFQYQFKNQDFGERCALGWTIGEEVIIQPGAQKRLESVIALQDSCLMQVKMSDLTEMQSKLLKVGAGLTFIEDHQVLMQFFESNHDMKQEWRNEVGIIMSTQDEQ